MEVSSVSHTLATPLLLVMVVSAPHVSSNVSPSIGAHLRRRFSDHRPTGHHLHPSCLNPTLKFEGGTARRKQPVSLAATTSLLLAVVVSTRNSHSSMIPQIGAHLRRRACDRPPTGHRLHPSCQIPTQKVEGDTARRKQPAVLVATSLLPLLLETPDCFRPLKGVDQSLDYLVLLVGGSDRDTRNKRLCSYENPGGSSIEGIARERIERKNQLIRGVANGVQIRMSINARPFDDVVAFTPS